MTAKSASVSASLPPYLFVGIKGCVVALRRETGEVAWSTALERGSSLVPLVVEGGSLFAVSGGEVSCLDPRNGNRLWHNKLKGYGTSYAMLAGAQNPSAMAALEAAAAAAAAASGAAAASASG